MSKWQIQQVAGLHDPATGALVGMLGANGTEYLFGTQAGGTAQPTLYNPAAVAITGGSATLSTARTSTLQSALTDGSGTPGNVTQNVMHGRAAFAAAASTVVVTNSQVAANSSVFVVLQTADATLTQILRATPAAGSFTVTGNAAATATTVFDYFVLQN
jgi:hypothetical protein